MFSPFFQNIYTICTITPGRKIKTCKGNFVLLKFSAAVSLYVKIRSSLTIIILSVISVKNQTTVPCWSGWLFQMLNYNKGCPCISFTFLLRLVLKTLHSLLNFQGKIEHGITSKETISWVCLSENDHSLALQFYLSSFCSLTSINCVLDASLSPAKWFL